jgi:hypothetical protein
MLKPIRRRRVILPIFVLLISTLLLSSCSTKELTSEAYRFGKETGAKWRDLSNEIEAISSWANEESEGSFEIPEAERESACKAMWLIIGWPKFGLENMSENRKNFVEGCLKTIGS